jgi:hypothetical protein
MASQSEFEKLTEAIAKFDHSPKRLWAFWKGTLPSRIRGGVAPYSGPTSDIDLRERLTQSEKSHIRQFRDWLQRTDPENIAISSSDESVEGEDKSVEGEDKSVGGEDESVEGEDESVEGEDKSVGGEDESVEGEDESVGGEKVILA